MILKYTSVFLISLFTTKASLSQRVIAEFKSKNYQRDFRAIPHDDHIFLSYEEFVGPSKTKVKQVKWIDKDGKVENIYCPVDVFAVTSYNGKIYYYYRDEKSLKAFVGEIGAGGMSPLSESVEFSETILASYVDDNLFFILLNEDGMEISILEIAGMSILNTKKYRLPISLDEFINKSTYIEFYDEPALDSFKGRARVKIVRHPGEILFAIDDKREAPTKKQPHVTHIISLGEDGSVKHSVFPLIEKSDFGSYVLDGKLFQSVISRQQFSLFAYDLSSAKLLMRKTVFADSVDFQKKRFTQC